MKILLVVNQSNESAADAMSHVCRCFPVFKFHGLCVPSGSLWTPTVSRVSAEKKRDVWKEEERLEDDELGPFE